jgi:hypothetical protein
MNRALVAALIIAVTIPSAKPASATPLLLQAATFQLNGVSFGSAPDGTSYPTNVPPGAVTPCGNPIPNPCNPAGTWTFLDTVAGANKYFGADFFVLADASDGYASFFDSYGVRGGSASVGACVSGPCQPTSWEIDPPDYDSAVTYVTGDIIAHTVGAALDNMNGVPSGQDALFGCTPTVGPGGNCNDEVSLALGFTYRVQPGQEALIQMVVCGFASGAACPTGGGLYLESIANTTGEGALISGSVTVQQAQPVPEPASLMLLATGCVTGAARRLRPKRRS